MTIVINSNMLFETKQPRTSTGFVDRVLSAIEGDGMGALNDSSGKGGPAVRAVHRKVMRRVGGAGGTPSPSLMRSAPKAYRAFEI